jgi:hypothetical protein
MGRLENVSDHLAKVTPMSIERSPGHQVWTVPELRRNPGCRN